MEDVRGLLLKSKETSACDAEVTPHAQALVLSIREMTVRIENEEEFCDEEIEELLLKLRIIRNVLATGTDVGPVLLHFGLVEVLAALVDANYRYHVTKSAQVQTLSAQVVSNATHACGTCAMKLWEEMFPQRFLYLAISESAQTGDALALSLLAMSKKIPGSIEDLSGEKGAVVMGMMLQAEERVMGSQRGEDDSHDSAVNDSLGLLLVSVCFEENMLKRLVISMQSDGRSNEECQYAGACCYSNTQHGVGSAKVSSAGASVVLLSQIKILSTHSLLFKKLGFEAKYMDNVNVYHLNGREPESMGFLVDIVAHLAGGQVHGQTEQQVLQDTLHLLRDIYARKDDGAGISGGYSLVLELQECHAIDVMLLMLQALKPIRKPQQPVQPPCVDAPRHLQGIKLTSEQPYHGYRSDVISGRVF